MVYSIPSLVRFEQLLDPIKFLYFWKYNKRITGYHRLKYELFSRQAIAKTLFVLDSRYTRDTLYRVWFDLNNSLTQWKRPIFKIRYLRNSQISVWKTNFFLGKLYQKFLLFYTLSRPKILHTEFDPIWTTPWPDEKDLFLKFFIRNNCNIPIEKLTFFLGK